MKIFKNILKTIIDLFVKKKKKEEKKGKPPDDIYPLY